MDVWCGAYISRKYSSCPTVSIFICITIDMVNIITVKTYTTIPLIIGHNSLLPRFALQNHGIWLYIVINIQNMRVSWLTKPLYKFTIASLGSTFRPLQMLSNQLFRDHLRTLTNSRRLRRNIIRITLLNNSQGQSLGLKLGSYLLELRLSHRLCQRFHTVLWICLLQNLGMIHLFLI